MKNFFYLLVMFLWVLGGIGGIGYALYGGSWPCAVGCAINTVLAFPFIKDCYKKMVA